MQVIVCKHPIGWRSNSRKIVLYSTDESFHLAGDGKLAGIVIPNDEKCHMEIDPIDKKYTYSKGLEQDFPSVNQISYQAAENNVIIIFAVTKEKIQLHETLRQNVALSRSGELRSDSSNIVELITTVYNEIKNTVKMGAKSKILEKLSIDYKVKCPGKTDWVPGQACSDIKQNEIIDFSVTVTVKECLKEGEEYLLEIGPEAFEESVKIVITTDCKCDCEKNGVRNSDKCKGMSNDLIFRAINYLTNNILSRLGHGTAECGICTCNPNYRGVECQCEKNAQHIDSTDSDATCKNINTNKTCDGHGSCVCGQCLCDKRFSGPFCECDNESCAKIDGKLCSDNGKCLPNRLNF